MIIGGIIAVIAGVIAILGVSALVALAGSAEGIGLLYASSILVTIISVIEIIAGAKGLKACKVPENAGKCVTWGSVIAVLSIISMVIGLIVSIFQTVTSIQEQTLTFVPKVVGIFLTLMLLGDWMLNSMANFAVELWSSFNQYIH